MVQKDEDNMEYFVERLMYNVKRVGDTNMGLDVLKIVLLRGIREEFLGYVELDGKGGYLEGIL